jgi:hypothetical protein
MQEMDGILDRLKYEEFWRRKKMVHVSGIFIGSCTLKTPKFDRLKYQITKQLYSMK